MKFTLVKYEPCMANIYGLSLFVADEWESLKADVKRKFDRTPWFSYNPGESNSVTYLSYESWVEDYESKPISVLEYQVLRDTVFTDGLDVGNFFYPEVSYG